MELIKGQTVPSVWLAAVEYLEDCPDQEDFDVILHVAEPTVLSKQDAAVYREVDRFLTGTALSASTPWRRPYSRLTSI